MPRVRARNAARLRGFDWPTYDEELAEGVPLDRYTDRLARWQATAAHWFVNGFDGQPWPGDGATYGHEEAVRDLRQARQWEDAARCHG